MENKTTQAVYVATVVILSTTIAVLNFYAYRYFWYWNFWWFDMVMHTLGGILVGSLAVLFLFFYGLKKNVVYSTSTAAFFAFATISIIGVGWELFEFSAKNLIFLPQHNPWNTASDLFFDGVGCALAVIIFSLLYNNKKD